MRITIGLVISLASIATWAATEAPKPCTLDWAKDGVVAGVNSAWGIGISSNSDPSSARDEAKAKAFGDINLQLKSSVQTDMNLTETDKTTAFSGLTSIENKMEAVTGMKVVKEGSDAKAGITSCVAAKLDVRAAYDIPQGKMKVLQASVQGVSSALNDKKYLQVLRLATPAKKTIKDAASDIALADVYKAYLKEQGPTWNEQFNGLLGKITDAENLAKNNVVFVLPTGNYDEAFVDIESNLSGQGFTVVNKLTDVEKGKLPVSIELKQVGSLRKSKSALGATVSAKIAVFMRDGTTKKELSSNKGADVVGTGSSEEDALNNVSRQLSTHIVQVINSGLPGLIQED
jgi:hypothetical protein